jgi:aminoglycoside phosphotransferase (APT) family kinase protein
MQRLQANTTAIAPEIADTWNQALTAPMDTRSTWLHGDLHPRNILVENGAMVSDRPKAIAGIVDWGDMTSGDIATDLASIWMLFSDRTARQQAIIEYAHVSKATLQRAKGWAILFGVVLLDTGLVDNPRHAVMGERTLRRVAEDA